MERRILLAGFVATGLAVPLGSLKAQGHVPRVALLSWFKAHRLDALASALRERGLIDGVNVRLGLGVADNDPVKCRSLAEHFVHEGYDVIVADATPAAIAARAASRSLPIVAMLSNPLASGLIDNLARPGGNVTGFSVISTDLAPKRLELARAVMPSLAVAGFIGASADPNATEFRQQFDRAGLALGVRVETALADFGQLPAVVRDLADRGAQALLPQPLFVDRASELIGLASERGLPVFGAQRPFAEAGAVMALAGDPSGQVAGVADYIQRILKGAKPGDLPFQQADRSILIVNRSAAYRYSLSIPATVLLQADEVIE